MKILKDKKQSLLFSPLGIKDTMYMVCTVLLFFDLDDPDTLCTEQELWQSIPPLLGQGNVLDMSMPKPRGEFIVIGKCFTPRGIPAPASQVSVRVGNIKKTLFVFGNRYWKKSLGGKVITDPEPFKEMPITWQNAFGGKKYKKNPLGKGIDPVVLPNGKEVIPLPNIEDPKHLIGSPLDRPDPMSFGPIDLMWPQRFKKQGTYDEKWLKERWPYFPDDMNYEFFNCASEDQFFPKFFKGDESIEIVNMNPDIPVLKSRLPGIRARCFVTKKKNIDAPPEEDSFVEVEMHRDTVWLFPEIRRGILIFRGTTEIQDDEYGDIRWIFLKNEQLSEEPKPIEYYLEEQKKRLERGVPIDTAPFEAANQKIAKAIKRFKFLPKEIEEKKLKMMGKRPKMRYSVDEIVEKSISNIEQKKVLVDTLEAKAREMHAKWGHLVKIPLEKFGQIRNHLDTMKKKVLKTASRVKKMQEETSKQKEKAAKNIAQSIRDNVPEDLLKQTGVDPDNLIPEEKREPWPGRGFPLVIQWRKNFERNREVQDKLRKIGFEKRTLKRAWLGINNEQKIEDPECWGLESKDEEKIIIPSGLVIPHFKEATLVRFWVRPGEYNDPSNDFLMPGSDREPLFLSAIDDEAPIIRVADELEAWLVEQEVGDACSVVVLREPDEELPDEVKEDMEKALCFLVVVSKDFPEDKWDKWKKVYPDAIRLYLPKGENIFDLVKENIDIRKWIMDALPLEFAKAHQLEPLLLESEKPPSLSEGFKLPMLNVKDIVNNLMKEIKASYEPKIKELELSKIETEKKIKDSVVEQLGKGADKLVSKTTKPPSFIQSSKNIAKSINKQKNELSSKGCLTPEIEKKMDSATQKVLQMGEEADEKYKQAKTKAEAAKEKLNKLKAGEIPEELKKKFEKAGIDPKQLKKLTREEVIERYQKNRSLKGAILSDLDLSGLDFEGIDLTNAQCRKTKFCNCNLKGAIFNQTLANEADFSGALLTEANMKKSVFIKAKFKETILRNANISQGIFTEADLEKTDFTNSVLKMSVFQKANMKKIQFSDVYAYMCVFTGADLSEVDCKKSRLEKCLFKKTLLNRTDFSKASFNSTLFYEALGEQVKFIGADLSKARMGKNAQFSGADFRNIKMHQGCFRDSNLSDALFQGSEIEMSIFEGCDLTKTDFYRVKAKKTRFIKSNLESADMRGINLFLGSLRKTRIVNTDLRGANLYGVDFYKSIMGDTKLDDSNIKKTLIEKNSEILKSCCKSS